MGKRKGFKVEIANRVDGATFAADRLEQAVHRIAIDHGFEAGDVSWAIVSGRKFKSELIVLICNTIGRRM